MAPFLCHHHFYFFSTSSSSLSLLPPLPLFTSFFLLHFLHFYTISCLENHFSRLPNLIFSISQNIFSNPWVLDHLCDYSLASFFYIFFISAPFLAKKITSLGFQTWFFPSLKISFQILEFLTIFMKPIFWNSFSFEAHLCISMASPHGPTSLTFNGKKYHPSLEWKDEEGLLQDPSTHARHSSKKDFKWAYFFAFFVGKFVDFLFCWELYSGILSFCCCLSLWEFWTLLHLVGNHCVVMFFFFFWHFLNCWVVWYCEIWTMLMVCEALHCM